MTKKNFKSSIVSLLFSIVMGIGCTTTIQDDMNKETQNMTEQVTAVVILRNSFGLSILDSKEPITAANESKYQVESYIFDQASNLLIDLGIEVIQVGTHTLTIATDQATFESVFRTLLEKKSREPEGTYFELTNPILIPEDLTHLIAGVDIETPIDYFP